MLPEIVRRVRVLRDPASAPWWGSVRRHPRLVIVPTWVNFRARRSAPRGRRNPAEGPCPSGGAANGPGSSIRVRSEPAVLLRLPKTDPSDRIWDDRAAGFVRRSCGATHPRGPGWHAAHTIVRVLGWRSVPQSARMRRGGTSIPITRDGRRSSPTSLVFVVLEGFAA
jgi:hypothetical protein